MKWTSRTTFVPEQQFSYTTIIDEIKLSAKFIQKLSRIERDGSRESPAVELYRTYEDEDEGVK